MAVDVSGNTIEVGKRVLFHPKGLSSVSDHLAFGVVSRITSKTVYVEYHCEYIDKGTRIWGTRKEGLKEYPRRFDQVYILD